ncbi:LysR family transcriptional regulator [Salinibius halmophilus]|uniref:LysR family transcriptional regulator n=1 Tax=Salinibius halmophilus TaxID=1853216 RepID=UPI000E672ED1|nr:LysR family transcriptional regulator [Salinibius halmophilus]
MSRLNYHHLYYFWQVAQQGNLTKTAQALHVSQSALSNQIKQLEQSMDCALFERAGKKLVLTEAGEKAVLFANDIFTRGEELENLLRFGEQGQRSHISIGISSYMSRNFIEEFIAPTLANSDCRVTLHSNNLPTLLERLANHKLDLLLTNKPIELENEQPWIVQLLSRQPVSIVCPPELADKHYHEVSWVLPSRYHAIRSEFEAFCQTEGFTAKIKMEVDDMAMLRLMARDHYGYSVLPTVVARDELAAENLVVRHTFSNLFERFYAVTLPRVYQPDMIHQLLNRY